MKKINFEDIIQVSFGSALLAIPVAFTEEAWNMSETLPNHKVIMIFLTSLLFNASFIFYGVYQGQIRGKFFRFLARIFINYGLTVLTVTYILFLLDILSNSTNMSILSKIVLISFPASFSGAIVDSFDKE